MYQNYPNQFNPTTNTGFTIPNFPNGRSGFASLKVYNIQGQEVATLINKEMQAGSYKIKYDGSNLPSGVYFYSLKAENFYQVGKMLLIK